MIRSHYISNKYNKLWLLDLIFRLNAASNRGDLGLMWLLIGGDFYSEKYGNLIRSHDISKYSKLWLLDPIFRLNAASNRGDLGLMRLLIEGGLYSGRLRFNAASNRRRPIFGATDTVLAPSRGVCIYCV